MNAFPENLMYNKKYNSLNFTIGQRSGKYIFAAIAVVLLIAAILSPHQESIMDIVFFVLSFISAAISINIFRKNREEKRSRLY